MTKPARCLWMLLLFLLTGQVYLRPAVAQVCPHDGDVNQDGTLTPADALLTFQHFLGMVVPPLDDCQLDRADVLNPVASDDRITPADALCIFQRFLNLPSCGDVRLVWNAPTRYVDGTPVTDIVGYKLYYGYASRQYNFVIDVGDETTYTLTGLEEGQTYYFAITAYDTTGATSDFSNEVWTTVPP